MALLPPVAASGACGSRNACFQYTQAEFNVNNSCPDPSSALASFTDPNCPGDIISVDGPGTFDGQICCYPVTYGDITSSCGMGGANTGTTGTTTFPGTTGTTGTGTTTLMCPPTCAASVNSDDSAPCGSTSSFDAWQALQPCACGGFTFDGGGTCGLSCGSFCQSLGLDPTCSSCLSMNCLSLIQNCMSN
jgi:hypothetical protein